MTTENKGLAFNAEETEEVVSTSHFRATGWDEFDEIEETLDKEIEQQRAKTIYRMWLPPEGQARIVFLDSRPPIISEHQVQVNGDWRNWFTCVSDIHGDCPLCASGSRAETIGFFTIIDTTEFVDSRGETRSNERRLLGAKYTLLKNIKKLTKEYGDLRGMMFDVTRTSSKAVNTGDKWEYVGKLTEEELAELNENTEPAPYATITAPKTPDEIRAILSGAKEEEADETLGDEEDIDF